MSLSCSHVHVPVCLPQHRKQHSITNYYTPWFNYHTWIHCTLFLPHSVLLFLPHSANRSHLFGSHTSSVQLQPHHQQQNNNISNWGQETLNSLLHFTLLPGHFFCPVANTPLTMYSECLFPPFNCWSFLYLHTSSSSNPVENSIICWSE